jgi:hypothetical protein
MVPAINLSFEEMWEKIMACDRNYDGLFFTAVKTTKIYLTSLASTITSFFYLIDVMIEFNICFFRLSRSARRSGLGRKQIIEEMKGMTTNPESTHACAAY